MSRYLSLLLCFVLLGSVATPAVGNAPRADTRTPGGSPAPARVEASRPGRLITLYADPVYKPYHVPVPAAVTQRLKGPGAQSATITVRYTGFSPEAQAAFQSAVDIWQTLINSPVVIKVDAYWTALGDGVLGSAGPCNYKINFTNSPAPDTWFPIALANSLAGSDLDTTSICNNSDPSGYDIRAQFNNTGIPWYTGTGTPGFGEYDLTSVVLHELGHGLGFTGSMASDGSTGSWGSGGSEPDYYDRFVVNGTGQLLISDFPNASAALLAQLTSDSIFWNGANAIKANSNTRPKLYAPATWSSGSSIAHLDEGTYAAGNANALMTPFLNNGESVHSPGPITLCLFKDLGWSVNASLLTSAPVTASAGPAPQFDPLDATTIFLPLIMRPADTAC